MSLYSENAFIDFDPSDLVTGLVPRIVRAGEGRAYSYLGPGITGSCLADAASTGGAYSLFEIVVAPGAGIPLHIHAREDETFYGVDGTFQIQRGAEAYTLEAGMCVYGPRRIPHAFRNVGATTGRLVVVTTPGGFENFFAALEAGKSTFGDLAAPAARQAFVTLLAEWGMRPLFEAPEPVKVGIPPMPLPTGRGTIQARLLVPAEQTDGAISLSDAVVDPQGGPPPHVHTREDEGFYLLSGHLDVRIGNAVIELGAGDFVFGPRQIAHGWRNVGETPARLIGIASPGANFQAFTREMEDFIARVGMPLVALQDPLQLRQIGLIFQKYGLAPAHPVSIK